MSGKLLFECYNCGAVGIFENVYQPFREGVIPKCPICGIEEQEYIYFDKLLTADEAKEKARNGESDEVELIDLNCGYIGSRTYKVRGCNEEVLI